MKTKIKSEITSSMKRKWIELPNRDMSYWLGQYIVASMALNAYDEKKGFPTHVGKIKDMKPQKDGSGLIEFEARYGKAKA